MAPTQRMIRAGGRHAPGEPGHGLRCEGRTACGGPRRRMQEPSSYTDEPLSAWLDCFPGPPYPKILAWTSPMTMAATIRRMAARPAHRCAFRIAALPFFAQNIP